MNSEMEEIIDIIDFCTKEMDKFPLSVQLQICQEFTKLGENLRPIYDFYKNQRESNVLDLLKELLLVEEE